MINKSIVGRFGKFGGELGHFKNPSGIAIDPDGRIIVADTNNNRIQIFEPDRKSVKAFGFHGDADKEFDCPSGVAIDPDGRIIVADTNNDRIQIFEPDGTFIDKFGCHGGGDKEFKCPSGVAVDPKGRIIVADTNNNRIQIFEPDGTFIDKFGCHGGGDKEFSCPRSVAVDPKGRIIVADTNNNRIQIFELDLEFSKKFGMHGFEPGCFRLPYGVTTIPISSRDRKIIMAVADTENNRVQILNEEGKFIETIKGIYNETNFNHPERVVLDTKNDKLGRIFVTDTWNNEIKFFVEILKMLREVSFNEQRKTFWEMKDELLHNYPRMFVAILDQEVVGAKKDEKKLLEYIYKEYGYDAPVYIKKVDIENFILEMYFKQEGGEECEGYTKV